MVEQHLAILPVALPLLVAPVVALLPGRRWAQRAAWAITLMTTTLCFVLSARILGDVMSAGPSHYALGGWVPPWGIAYKIDGLNALMAVIVSGMGALAAVYAGASVKRDIAARQQPLFYAAFLLCFVGLLGMCLTGDIFNVFVFLEISSLASYALIGMGRNRRATTVAFQYLIMGTIGATFFLIGIGLVYAATGSLNMADLAARLPSATSATTARAGFAFIIIGMALKAAMFPLHLWLPRAYTYAPMLVTAFLAGTATKVAVYVLARVVFTVFSPSYAGTTIVDELLLGFGAVAVIYGAAQALRQTSVKPLLAWSSVSQIGYFMLGLGLLSAAGLTALMVLMFNHALIKTALFMAAGVLLYQTGNLNFAALAGAGKRMPLTFAAVVVALLSLIGVPGTAGFISKWYLIIAAMERQSWWMVAVVVTGSALAVAYAWKLLEALYFQPLKTDAQDNAGRGGYNADAKGMSARRAAASPALLAPTYALAAACVYFGIDTDIPLAAATAAAAALGLDSGLQ